MKAIVIGSKGFIGQHLYNYLQGKGYDVWGVDVIVDYVNSERYFLIDASNSDYSSVFQPLTYDFNSPTKNIKRRVLPGDFPFMLQICFSEQFTT